MERARGSSRRKQKKVSDMQHGPAPAERKNFEKREKARRGGGGASGKKKTGATRNFTTGADRKIGTSFGAKGKMKEKGE